MAIYASGWRSGRSRRSWTQPSTTASVSATYRTTRASRTSWLRDIPAFAIEDYADHGKDVLTLGEACDFMERMRGKYVEEHRDDANSRVAACL